MVRNLLKQYNFAAWMYLVVLAAVGSMAAFGSDFAELVLGQVGEVSRIGRHCGGVWCDVDVRGSGGSVSYDVCESRGQVSARWFTIRLLYLRGTLLFAPRRQHPRHKLGHSTLAGILSSRWTLWHLLFARHNGHRDGMPLQPDCILARCINCVRVGGDIIALHAG